MKWYRVLPACIIYLFAGCSNSHDISVVTGFEAEKYMGKWYEIARLPNWFESGMTNVSAEYLLSEDGEISVYNRGTKYGKERFIAGKARFRNSRSTGELEVSFFGPFYSGYRIIKLPPDYRYSIVVGDNRDFLWILGRETRLDPADMDEIMVFLREQKFAVEKLIYSN